MDDEKRVRKTEARQGITGHGVRYVLITSLLLALMMAIGLFLWVR